jgi:hypothetical protein
LNEPTDMYLEDDWQARDALWLAGFDPDGEDDE